MSVSPTRTTVLVYSTLLSTHTKPPAHDASQSPTTETNRAEFTRIAIGAAIGGFFMTVLLAAALVWLWKRKHPWAERDVETSHAAEEDKASRSPPVSDSVCSPRDYEYGSYGNPAALAVNPAARPGSALSVNSMGRKSPTTMVASPSSASLPALPLSRRATLEREYSMPETHFMYPSPALPASPPSAWHRPHPPLVSVPLPRPTSLPPSPKVSKRRPSLPPNAIPHTHYRSMSGSSYQAPDFTSASSHSSHSSRRLITTHQPKVFFLDPDPDPPLEEERGPVRLAVTNPDEPTPPPTPREPKPNPIP